MLFFQIILKKKHPCFIGSLLQVNVGDPLDVGVKAGADIAGMLSKFQDRINWLFSAALKNE